MNITSEVYNLMSEQTTEIGVTLKKYNQLNDELNSGHYTSEYLDKYVRPEMAKLRREMDDRADKAMKDADTMIEKYLLDVERAAELRADDLTDDVKLLNCGVTLNAKDVRAIMRRNEGNQTMIGLCARYAAEKGLDLGRDVAYTNGIGESVQTANALRDALKYYRRYMVQNDGPKMLNRFFNVTT